MTWFKVDDKLHDHRKARAAGKTAMGVWVLCGSWSSDNLTDGFVPDAILLRHGNRSDAERLVKAGLWTAATQDGETGWQFHQWSPTNPLRTDVESTRERSRERMERVRANKPRTDSEPPANVRVTPSRPVLEEPLTPLSGDESSHDGTHPNCRACGTNPRTQHQAKVGAAFLDRHSA